MKGVYVLLIQLTKNVDLKIGKLGSLSFGEGLYAYVGSAQVGLEKRIERHLRKEKSIFWHIDYLLMSRYSKITKVFCLDAGKRAECAIAGQIESEGEAIVGFGCSDCSCRSHLFRLRDFEFLGALMQEFKIHCVSASS